MNAFGVGIQGGLNRPGFLYLLQAFFDGHPYLRFGARNLSTQGWKDTTFFWMKDMKGT